MQNHIVTNKTEIITKSCKKSIHKNQKFHIHGARQQIKALHLVRTIFRSVYTGNITILWLGNITVTVCVTIANVSVTIRYTVSVCLAIGDGRRRINWIASNGNIAAWMTLDWSIGAVYIAEQAVMRICRNVATSVTYKRNEKKESGKILCSSLWFGCDKQTNVDFSKSE